jgi:plasmid stabilization system protein ParE
MKVVLSARVEEDIARQLQYSIEHFGQATAQRTFARVDSFLFRFLSAYPDAGTYIEELGIYEAWISRTPFVVFYRVQPDAGVLTVLALFHHAQDRGTFAPED